MSILFIQLSKLIFPCTVFRLQYTENALVAIYSRTFKEFHVLKKNFKKFFQIVYAIHVSTFRLFINEYGEYGECDVWCILLVFVITALKS